MSLDQHMSAELAAELAANNVKRLVDPRSLQMRYSLLKHIAKSPAHLLAAAQGDSEDTGARRVGRGSHALALRGNVAVWDGKTESGRARPRNGKDWEAFKAKYSDCEILNGKEAEQAQAIADAVKRHPVAAEMLYTGGTLLEHVIEWRYMGRKFVSHLDAYRRAAFVMDLKGVKDGEPGRFSRTALWSYYLVQLAMYVTAAEYIGDPTPDPYFCVVENTEPYATTIMRMSPRALESGRKTFHLWVEKLLACESAGVWPAYAQDVVELDVPDKDEPFLLTYQGDEVEI